MVRLVINSIAELRVLQAKINALKNTFPALQKQAIDKTANEDLLEEIHDQMGAHDFSPKIINATFVGRTEISGNRATTHIISNYVSDTGFDVSRAREEGTTQPNPIRPKRPGGSLKIPVLGLGEIFRKLSRPTGIPRLLIIERTIRKKQNELSLNYKDNLAQLVSRFLGA